MVLPAERSLKDLVKPRDARIASHQQAPPDQRVDAAQHGAPLQGLGQKDDSASIPEAYFAALHSPKNEVVSKTPKRLQLHLIMDNYSTHTHPDVQAWLTKHPRVGMHFTPTNASWLNMVERFFRDISEQRSGATG
jgi:hypothetical protein